MNGQSEPIGLLAELVARMRPGWTLDAVKAALSDPFVMRKDFPAVVAAVGVCYGDPSTKAPGRLTVDGPWWRLCAKETPVPAKFAHGPAPERTNVSVAAKEQIRAQLAQQAAQREKAEA